jgi:hypothetical protein
MLRMTGGCDGAGLGNTSSKYYVRKGRGGLCRIHCKKSFSIFPFPHAAGMSLTKLSLGGNNDVIYKLFPHRKSLVSDIPAGDGNTEKLFLLCRRGGETD